MNTKQKVGLSIIVPLFAIAAGHTIVNKINQQKQQEHEKILMYNDIDLAISKMSLAKEAEFKARQNVLKNEIDVDSLVILAKQLLNEYNEPTDEQMQRAKDIIDLLHK